MDLNERSLDLQRELCVGIPGQPKRTKKTKESMPGMRIGFSCPTFHSLKLTEFTPENGWLDENAFCFFFAHFKGRTCC